MLNIIFLIFAFACCLTFSLLFVEQLLDFWIIIASFVGGYFLAVIIFLLVLGIFCLFVNKKKEYNKYNKFYHGLMIAIIDYACWICGVKIQTSGLDKIPAQEKFMLVCNHRSGFDPLIALVVLNNLPLIFISKPSNFKIPFADALMIKNGFVSIDRDNPRKALLAISRSINHIKNDVYSVAVYPEGTRNKEAVGLLPFKTGCFKISEKTGAKIVVTTVNGTEKISKNIFKRKTIVKFDVLDVLNFSDYETTQTVSDKAYELMLNNLQ